MTAILLVACCALGAAVGVLAVTLRRQRGEAARALTAIRAEQAAVERRLAALEMPREAADLSPGLVTGASAPSSTSGAGGAGGPSSTSGAGGAGGPSSTSGTGGDQEYVITRLGDEPGEVDPVERPDPRLFADLVLRESVVKAASFAHGVRRGLSAENRNRIRFEMRREVKRARKQRRAEERAAVREWRARQRAAMTQDDAA